MQKIIIIIFGILTFYILQTSCNSCKKEAACIPTYQSQVGFNCCEVLKDTFLPTDTAYINRLLVFQANKFNDSIKFKIGDDPRIFNSNFVSLFFRDQQTIKVNYNAIFNNGCQTTIDSLTKSITLVQDDTNHISPLVGSYLGYNTDNPNDTFSIAIKFWIGPRYPWWQRGTYTLDNLPKGYKDAGTRTFNGYSRPEITGLDISVGYKNLTVNESNTIPPQGIKGYASLKRGSPDTLIFNYRLEEYLPNFQIKYHQKQFIGIKKI